MPRRLLKGEAKRLILTCFETFIEANKDEHRPLKIKYVFCVLQDK
jgi:hypothetical protein